MIDFSKILLNSSIYSNDNLNIKNINSNNKSFSRLLESSILSLDNSSGGCKCSGNNTSFDSLINLIGIVNQNKINNINTDENNSNSIELNNISNKYLDATNNDNNSSNITPSMEKAINLLKDQVGKPYVWGGNGPESFDCSGLVRYIYKNALGKDLPRVSYEQSKVGQAVDKSDLQVGDLVFFDTMNKGRVSHVGIYIGNNEFIHAANSKKGVIKSTLSGYYEQKYMGARRP